MRLGWKRAADLEDVPGGRWRSWIGRWRGLGSRSRQCPIGKIGGEVTKAMGKREEESEKGETRKKRKIKKEREK